MEQLNESAWEVVHPEIPQAARAIAEAGHYDDAIFAAFRCVEGEIQERIQSASVGSILLNEAFDGPSPQVRVWELPDHSRQTRLPSLSLRSPLPSLVARKLSLP